MTAALSVGASLAVARPAAAQDWTKLVMPGPVIEGHAELEDDCSNCHRPFRRSEQRSLCLACHDHQDVADDIQRQTGFHGRGQARVRDCSTCHGEHEGRQADIVGLDPETFDHDLTDFALEARHQTTPCAGCHAPNEAFREASQECSTCHGKDDAHRGALGDDCASCHSPAGWKQARFDHDQTAFRLRGKHTKVPCASCHPNEQYEATPENCYACHQLHDAHAGNFGRGCESCHSTAGWSSVRFDHARDTDFPLRGAHASAACEACHNAPPEEAELPRDCYGCHRTDDEHKGRFGTSCDSCHGERRWQDDAFDHGKTAFPLKGAHRQLTCVACHTGVIGDTQLGTDCRQCHAQDDVHQGEQGKDCGACHRESGWASDVFFDHGLTRFPLLGLHAISACEECHTSKRFQKVEETCVACHRSGDFHEGRLGESCELCHNPNGWDFWRFDHGSQTDFPLDGAHAELRCHDCHTQKVSGRPDRSSECAACHVRDDVHLGSYGRSCNRCHTTSGWAEVEKAP